MFHSNKRLSQVNTWQALFSSLSLVIFTALAFSPAHAESASGIMAPGDAAVTAFSGVINQAGGVSIDGSGPSLRVISLPVSGAFGLIDAPKTFTVTANQIGQVFGVALDDQPHPDIFVAATSAYGLVIFSPNTGRLKKGAPDAQFMPGQFGPAAQAGGPNSIWRIDGQTGEVTLFATITHDGIDNTPAALGGLAFDTETQQLFVADRATGLIHRFTLDGVDHGTFDHGVQGLSAAGLPPVPYDAATLGDITNPDFDTENPATWGYAPEPRRVFALAAHAHRLFYSVYGSQIWSVGLSATGAFSNDARLEVEVPSLAPGSEIASIAFDNQGFMYAAERGAPTGDYQLLNVADGGHNRVKRFAPKQASDTSPVLWTSADNEYAIGMPPNYQNADGGAALPCQQILWSTGERLLDGAASAPHIDGLQGNDTDRVKPANTPPKQSWFINYYDTQAETGSRGHMGALAILKVCGTSEPPVQTGYTCPAGTYLIDDDCVPPPLCPNGTVFRHGYCVYVDCPWGYVHIRNHKECVPPPKHCPYGTIYIDDRCVPVDCPPPLTLTRNGYCHCPNNYYYHDGRCLPPHTCPPGKKFIDGRCVPPHCPRNQQYVNGRCVPPHTCPSGQTYVNGHCVPPHTCPRGQQYINGHCVPTHTCPTDQQYINGHCVPAKHCKKGEILRNGRCIGIRIPVCKTGQILKNGICVTAPQKTTCKRGETLRNGVCVAVKITTQCPAGQTMKNGRCTTIKIKTRTKTQQTTQHACPKGQQYRNGHCVSTSSHGTTIKKTQTQTQTQTLTPQGGSRTQ